MAQEDRRRSLNETDSDSQIVSEENEDTKDNFTRATTTSAALLLHVVNARESPNSVIYSLSPKRPKIHLSVKFAERE